MWRTSKIINRLDRMLSDAINGTFVESAYDETGLSRLENKFRQYLTARELSEEKVQAERQEIKRLVSDISHQTKTPLANVLLYSQLLEEQCTDKELEPYLKQIRAQAEKLQFLIQSLVKLSRLESGMVEPDPVSQAVGPLILQAVNLVEGQAAEKEISLQAFPLTDAEAFFDMRWTTEALGNLLDNAVKYAPCGSAVRVSVRIYEMFVCISVSDEGPGIPEEEQAQIFERFFRGRNAAEKEGSGIGLYFVRMVLEKEQGYVRVTPGDGGGSCFQMFLKRNRSASSDI